MASLATNPSSDQSWRVRRRAATAAGTCRYPESVRFLSAKWSHTFRDRADQRWFAVAGRFQPRQQAEGVVREVKKPVSISTICSIYLSPCGGDHSWRLTDIRRVFLI